jgi:membrane peptidoglycan carboxypeptidase
MKAVDSLKFVSKLTRKDFRIVKYGRTNLSKMSGPFEYTAYEKGQAVKTFEVGPGNPDFRSYDQISPYLINAVLLCEDNGFPWHNGFLLEAFRGAIIENIKKGRFARGGSTITMQLVKNVFLNRNKTVVRKLEEMMIVWLIESNHLTSKNRMFEVYLNIIEWGPLVYGANSASHFYFKKDVSQLTIPEAIFMASIIPRPKYYQYCFDSGQVLKPYFIEHMNLIAGKMLKKEVISQDEFDRFIPVIKITGPARVKFIKADTINIFQLEPED